MAEWRRQQQQRLQQHTRTAAEQRQCKRPRTLYWLSLGSAARTSSATPRTCSAAARALSGDTVRARLLRRFFSKASSSARGQRALARKWAMRASTMHGHMAVSAGVVQAAWARVRDRCSEGAAGWSARPPASLCQPLRLCCLTFRRRRLCRLLLLLRLGAAHTGVDLLTPSGRKLLQLLRWRILDAAPTVLFVALKLRWAVGGLRQGGTGRGMSGSGGEWRPQPAAGAVSQAEQPSIPSTSGAPGRVHAP